MKINVNNTDKLRVALDDAQRRAKVRTITVKNVQGLVESIERRLGTLLQKKDWDGLAFLCDHHAAKFTERYNGVPESTHVVLRRTASGWFVTSIERGVCQPPTMRIVCLNLSTKAEEIVAYSYNKW